MLDMYSRPTLFPSRPTCSPTLFQMLEMYADSRPTALAGLRLVQFAGEKVRPDAVLKLANLLPNLALQHLYGCTEHTSCITSFICPSGAAGKAAVAATGGDRLPIGNPTTNVKCYVLSSVDLAEVDTGVTGELFVTSPQLSRGYRNRWGSVAGVNWTVAWLQEQVGISSRGQSDCRVATGSCRVATGTAGAQ